jgi:class 3 adenylate cyclase
MDQQIRFCTTADGVRIAYATLGEGPPLVAPPSWITHLELEWEMPEIRAFWQALARHHLLVRFDKHGSGLSERHRTEFTLASEVRPLEAVVDHLKLRRFALLGASQAGRTAIGYVAAHPRRVSRLILYATDASGSTIGNPEFRVSLMGMARAAWGVGSRTLVEFFIPGGDPETIGRYARYMRGATDGEMAARLLGLTYDIDVTDLLPQIRVPTIVLGRRGDRTHPFRLTRELAAGIPNTRLIPLEGTTSFPWLGDTESVLRAIKEFLGDPTDELLPPPTVPAPSKPPSSGVVTILFTDLAASTELLDRLGDESYEALRQMHFGLLRSAVAEHGGEEVKSLGDGLMVVFPSTLSALRCAVAMQQAVRRHNDQHPETPLQVRIGLHAGEPIREEGDYFGTPVVVARRLCEVAEGGQVLASDLVRGLAGSRGGVVFEPLGPLALKGFAAPVAASVVRA